MFSKPPHATHSVGVGQAGNTIAIPRQRRSACLIQFTTPPVLPNSNTRVRTARSHHQAFGQDRAAPSHPYGRYRATW
ncbi:MAG: hypothetical protein M5U34_13550 [Chloroflexi bacterium]|nr:hypothetical protein [Chloroflexota bacterium]